MSFEVVEQRAGTQRAVIVLRLVLVIWGKNQGKSSTIKAVSGRDTYVVYELHSLTM